ncbi:MAG: hypothetical protein LC624_01410 [Halobacteriales archaeon]|nr:hypothetical protein [Halobacteriales archaeon]
MIYAPVGAELDTSLTMYWKHPNDSSWSTSSPLPIFGTNARVVQDSGTNIYVVYSDGAHIYLYRLLGTGWSATFQVSGSGILKAIVPAAVGGTPGRVGVGWYESYQTGFPPHVVWRYVYAVVGQANTANPSIMARALVADDLALGADAIKQAPPNDCSSLHLRASSAEGKVAAAFVVSLPNDCANGASAYVPQFAVQTQGPGLLE